MTFVVGLLAVIAALAALLLMFVILLQEPKGGGIASALGGSGMEALGVSTGGVNRFTCWVAGVWIGACLLHSILQPTGPLVGRGIDKTAGAETAPKDTPTVDTPTPPGDGEKPK